MLVRKVLSVLLLLMILAVGVFPARAQTTNGSPQLMLLTYYNRLNVHDYQSAYALWYNPPQTFQNFENGFADSSRITPYLGDFQPSYDMGESGRLPAVLLGYQIDGSRVSYAGCVVFANTHSAQADWRILTANFQLISNKAFLSVDTIEKYLTVDCRSPLPQIIPGFSTPDSDRAYAAMATYYDLVNQKQFAAAYDMWLKPIPGPKPNGAPAQDYRLPYTQFVNGYNDSGYINIYLGDYLYGGASAGHSYLDGILPAVLVDQHTDNSIVSYYGCYVLGGLSDGNLGIVSGYFLPLPTPTTGVPTGNLILESLKIDCTQLALQF